MKTPFAIGGSIGGLIVLVAGLTAGFIWLTDPTRSVPAAKQMNFPAPDTVQLGTPATAAGFDPVAQTELIREILGSPDLSLTFDSVQPLTNAGAREAATYLDPGGSRYFIDLQTGRFSAIEPGPGSVREPPPGEALSMDALRSIATRFAEANSARLAELQQSLAYDEGCKGTNCFFRWDARTLPIDWSGTEFEMMPPFLQVGVSGDGQIFSYNNSLDLYQASYVAQPAQPTPEAIVAGGTVVDGPFTFDLRIYRDATLTRQPLAPSLYSDMEGFGAYTYWTYTGTDVIGPVTTYWGTTPKVDQLLQATYSLVEIGSSGGRDGGILLPAEAKAGDRERLVLKVATPDGDYGAVLVFTLQQGASGLEPADISVEPLPSS